MHDNIFTGSVEKLMSSHKLQVASNRNLISYFAVLPGGQGFALVHKTKLESFLTGTEPRPPEGM